MANAPGHSPERTASRSLGAETREQLLALLQGELERAGEAALARGVSQEELTAQLEDRIALLRKHIADLMAQGEPPAAPGA